MFHWGQTFVTVLHLYDNFDAYQCEIYKNVRGKILMCPESCGQPKVLPIITFHKLIIRKSFFKGK